MSRGLYLPFHFLFNPIHHPDSFCVDRELVRPTFNKLGNIGAVHHNQLVFRLEEQVTQGMTLRVASTETSPVRITTYSIPLLGSAFWAAS